MKIVGLRTAGDNPPHYGRREGPCGPPLRDFPGRTLDGQAPAGDSREETGHRVHVRKETWRQQADALGEQGIIIPLLESRGTVEGLEEIFSVKDLKCAFLGWTDLTRMLGHPFEYEHPEVLKFVDRAASLAQKHGVALMANAGYEYRSIDDAAARLHRMYERGIQILCLQPVTVMFQFWCQELLDKVSGKVPLALSPGASGPA